MKKIKFIEKARKIHGDKYDYSKVVYVNNKTKVCIICPIHGEFWQTPDKHLQGHGCPKCSKTLKKTTEEFKKEVESIHKGKYITTKVNYVNDRTKVCLICPTHGEFWITPHNCLQGQGCPKCSGNSRLTTDDFKERGNKVHNGKYDYSKSDVHGTHNKVCIICHEKDENGVEHGEFWQAPNDHLHGQGCPKCRGKKIWETRGKMSVDEIKERLNKIFGDLYDYSLFTEYKNNRTKIPIICKKHGLFYQSLDNHLQGHGCPKCACVESKSETEIYNYICDLVGKENVINRDRSILGGKEIDIYIPKLNLAIEYNGLRWHSEVFRKDKNYHLDKLDRCNDKGIKLIQIFEDEWFWKKNIILKKLEHILGLNKGKKIYARSCQIKEINKKEAYDFLEKNHIQGSVNSSVAIGCFKSEKLIGVMLFKEETEGNWNLTRFATDNDFRCVGVASKLFSAFIKKYNPITVKSFADRRWTLSMENNVYTNLGFQLTEILKPDYRYVNGMKRDHKFGYRKEILHKKYGVPLDWTEKEMTEHLGFYRIYDCGLLKYVWQNPKNSTF